MYRITGTFCAGALLLLSAGCWLDGKNVDVQANAFTPGKNGETSSNVKIINGSLESVQVSTQNALERMGLKVTATPQGQAIRLSSASRTGQRFDLILTRQTTTMGEQTQIRIEWEKNAEGFFFESIVRALMDPTATAPAESGAR
jgi:hypothetical protein